MPTTWRPVRHPDRLPRGALATGIAGFLVGILLTPGLVGGPARLAPVGPHPVLATDVPGSRNAPASSGPRPSGIPSVSGAFYGTTSVGADVPALCENSSAPGAVTSTCYPEAQNPSLLNLTNGELGIVFSTYTADPGGACPGRAATTDSRIAFAVSTDQGKSFGPSRLIQNTSCGYSNQLSPAFAVTANGTVAGVFVAESYLNTSAPQAPSLATDYVNQTPDALEFVRSSDNGSTFTAWRQLPAGTFAVQRPSIATFGSSIYVAYDDIANGSSLLGAAYGRNGSHPIAVDLLASANGGATWHGPYALPGLNAAENFSSMSPTVSVSPTGTVAVGYLTNRQCAANATPPCGAYTDYQDDVVVATSTTNGSSWNGPYTVQAGVGEAGCYSYDNGTAPYFYPDYCLQYLYQAEPQIALRWASSTALVAAYSGAPTNQTFFFDETSVLYSAVSTTRGASWNAETVQAPGSQSYQDEYSTPVLGISGGHVFLSYLWKNLTDCFIFTLQCPTFDTTYSAWVTESTDGASWGAPVLLAYAHGDSYAPGWFDSWSGFVGAMAFSTAAHPAIAFALDQSPASAQAEIGTTVYTTLTSRTTLLVATLGTGPTVRVTFQSNGLPSGTPWNVSLNGNVFATVATSLTVGNVPQGVGIDLIGPAPRAVNAWEAQVASLSAPSEATFVSNTTVDVNWSLDYGLTVSIAPVNNQYSICFCLDLNGNYYILFTSSSGAIEQPQMPWFFPAGAQLSFVHQVNLGTPATMYWNGTGPGSYTGPGAWANVTMEGPINETLWNGAFGNSSLAVTPLGLPAGTSYSFDLNGAPTGATAPNATYRSGLPVGAYTLSAAEAPSPSPGWEYFGTPSPGPTVVVPYTDAVNLTFSDVEIASAPVAVSFYAENLSAGVRWSIEFNGSTYASVTPWINLSVRPGSYPLRASTATAPDDSAGYASSGASWVNITAAGTYPIPYTPAYAVRVEAGPGGTVTPSGLRWVAPGGAVPLSATPDPGYTFEGWSGDGPGSYAGPGPTGVAYANASLIEVATFEPLPSARFNLTFLQFGLPAGQLWTVDLSGAGYASGTSVLVATGLLSCSTPAGHYAVSVPLVADNGTIGVRFAATPINGTLCQSGATPPTALVFSPQYEVHVQATSGGAATVANASAVGTEAWIDSGGSAALAASAAPGETFLGWLGNGPGNYTGPLALISFQPTGPVQEIATFGPSPPGTLRNLTFSPTPALTPGTAWAITVDGVPYLGTAPNLTVRGLPDSPVAVQVAIALAPDGRTRYVPLNASETIRQTGDRSVPLPYSVSFYGTLVAGPGGTVLPASGWFEASSVVRLRAVPDAGEVFGGWSSNGTGYSGGDPNGSFTVTGPFTEVAAFLPMTAAPGATGSSGAYPVLTSPWLWGTLAVIGLVVGLAGGILLRRRSTGDSPPTARQGPEEPEGGPESPSEGPP